MKEKKIHTALSALSTNELASFKKYVNSPYFNVNTSLIQFLDLLILCHKQEEESIPENQFFWEKIFPQKPYDDTRFRKLSSDLYKLFEDFLAQQTYEEDINLKTTLKFKSFYAKKIEKLYNSLITHSENTKRIDYNRNADHFLNQFNIEKNKMLFKLALDRNKKSKDLVSKLNLEEISFNLDTFYIAEKLKYYCEYLSWSISYNLDKKLTGIDIILKLAKMPQFSTHPPVAIYYTISQTILDGDNQDHYFELIGLIDEYIHYFPPFEARQILTQAISYCVVKVNKGISSFQEEALKLYKKGLKEDLMVIDNELSTIDFRNIAIFAIRCKEYQWAENFIHEYQKYLPEDQRDTNVKFSLARLYSNMSKYDRVIELLRDINYGNEVLLNLNARSMMVAAYYELDEFDALDYFLQSFKAYVDREKSLNKNRKSEYLKFIKYVKNFIKIFPNEKEKLQKLYDNIREEPFVGNKPWLLEKINAMLQKKGR